MEFGLAFRHAAGRAGPNRVKGEPNGMDIGWMILIVVVSGAVGGFVNVFIGDNGLHLPKVENGVLQPGYMGTVFVGAAAALASWGMAKAFVFSGSAASPPPTFSTADIANALLLGFGGAKWFKSENEKDVLQKTAAIAAGKEADPAAALMIASATPNQALAAAAGMHQ